MNTKPFLQYKLDLQTIIQKNYSAEFTKKTESIFAQGNSYLGIRAVDEEYDSLNKEDFFLAGLYNEADPSETTELANLANLLQNEIYIDDEKLILTKGDYYRKELILNSGEIVRCIEFHRKKNFFRFVFCRLVCQNNKHCYAQKIILEQLSGGRSKIEIRPMINGQSTNRGVQHFTEGTKRMLEANSLQYNETTNNSQQTVFHNMHLKVYDNKQSYYSGNDDFVIFIERRKVGFKIKTILKENNPLIIEKLMTVNCTQDNYPTIQSFQEAQNVANSLMHELKHTSYDRFCEENKKTWSYIYNQFPVQILGSSDEAKYDALALKFGLYHMNTFVPKYSEWYSVGAKGLSGEGYQGHCYWDTEFFIVPNYIFTNPKRARQLLTYRYHCLPGARKKAQENNYIGAQYPWETALPHEGEVTPYWGQPDIFTGQQIPIASREQEIHVPGDIAFIVDMYYQCTKDWKFMQTMGIEMIIDTAIFWTSRAEYNKHEDQYHITNVMGPNEYKGNIDDNAFTNQIAKRNLELAIYYINKLTKEELNTLQEIKQKLPYKYDLQKMQDVCKKIKIQMPNHEKIIPENNTFLFLPKKDLSNFKLLGDAGKKLFNTQEGVEKLSGQIVKQADVALLTYTFNELFDHETILANFIYYENCTTHDSSLSAATYTIQAIELRRMHYAYQLFKYAINIDLGTNFQSSNDGIHAGSLAMIYQMVVFGFGGLKFNNKKLHINPILPSQWDGLIYKFQYQNTWLEVKVFPNHFSINKLSGDDVSVYVQNQEHRINHYHEFNILHNYIKGLVFDLDGVITKTDHFHFNAWHQILNEYNIDFDLKESERLKGLSRIDTLKAILSNKNINLSQEDFDAITKKKNELYLKILDARLDESDILPGILDLLQAAKDMGLKMAIASSSKNASKILNLLNLTKYFDVIIDPSTIKNGKPNPEIFLKAAEALNLKPYEVIGLEDAIDGVKGMHDAKMFTIAITHGVELDWQKYSHVQYVSTSELKLDKLLKNVCSNY